MPKLDLPVLKESPHHVLVTVPRLDLLDMEHPKIIVTGKEYLPGETYSLEPNDADWVKSRIEAFAKAQRKINQPTADIKSIKESASFGSAKSGTYVNPHSLG